MTGADPAAQPADDAQAKYAMLSVYYASIDDQFTVSGAPSVAVPPEARPLPLDEALAILANDPPRLAQALWQIVRTTPIPQADETTSRYRPEITDYLSTEEQARLDQVRADYRTGASLVAACLRACHHGDKELFRSLRTAVESSRELRESEGFSKVVELLYDESPTQFVERLGRMDSPESWDAGWQEINRLEQEVDLGIAGYVEQLAATAAYESFIRRQSRWRNKTTRAEMRVFPVTSVIKQSIKQLWTKATVTTLARGRFHDLLLATEPENWHDGSDVVLRSDYTADPMDPERPGEPKRGPRKGDLQGFLYEIAAMTWGQDTTQQGVFRNVLNVQRELKPVAGQPEPAIEISFSLCRSISSDVLWDRRKGGITTNEGFLRVVPLGHNRWRISSRKLLQFSDRTPYSGSSGLTDFGQMLNYLAPAAMSWWVDTETYSLGRRAAIIERTTTTGSEDGNHE